MFVEEWAAGCVGRAGWAGAGAACPHKWFGFILSQPAGPIVGSESSEAQEWRLKTLLSFLGYLTLLIWNGGQAIYISLYLGSEKKKDIFFFH